MFRSYRLCIVAALTAAFSMPSFAGPGNEDGFHAVHPGEMLSVSDGDRRPIYSFPINTFPDGWAALKAEPWGDSRRMTKVYDGTLFLVVGAVPGWKLVQFKSGERGWIAERLVGCCRPPSH